MPSKTLKLNWKLVYLRDTKDPQFESVPCLLHLEKIIDSSFITKLDSGVQELLIRTSSPDVDCRKLSLQEELSRTYFRVP